MYTSCLARATPLLFKMQNIVLHKKRTSIFTMRTYSQNNFDHWRRSVLLNEYVNFVIIQGDSKNDVNLLRILCLKIRQSRYINMYRKTLHS